MGRPGGLLAAAVVAGVTFSVGLRLLPPLPARTAAPVATTAAARDERADSAVASAGAFAADAGDGGRASGDAGGADAAAADAATAASPEPARGPDHAADKERQQDRDIARAAWRRNLPDVNITRARSSILIPLKGSIEGATFHVSHRPPTVIVALPKAAALITMHFYRLGHGGLRRLWIDQAERNADPRDGTTLKLVLDAPSEPQVEIKDDFVRITVWQSKPGADGE